MLVDCATVALHRYNIDVPELLADGTIFQVSDILASTVSYHGRNRYLQKEENSERKIFLQRTKVLYTAIPRFELEPPMSKSDEMPAVCAAVALYR